MDLDEKVPESTTVISSAADPVVQVLQERAAAGNFGEPGPELDDIIATVQQGVDRPGGALEALLELSVDALKDGLGGSKALIERTSTEMTNSENVGRLFILKGALEVASKLTSKNGGYAKTILEQRMAKLPANPPPLPDDIIKQRAHQKTLAHGKYFEAQDLISLFTNSGSKGKNDEKLQIEKELAPLLDYLRQSESLAII